MSDNYIFGNIDIEKYSEYQKKVRELISEGKIEVEKVNLYLDLKINSMVLLDELEKIILKFHNNEASIFDDDYLSLTLSCVPSYFLEVSKTSFIAPAFSLNNYLDTLNQYTLNGFKNIANNELKLSLNVIIQSLFSSLKTLLDRLIPLASFYYPGISLTSTFGHIKESGVAKNFMKKVLELKDKDPLMLYIYENYLDWIKNAVSPRNMLTHYNDFTTRYHYTADGRTIPMHMEVKLFKSMEEIQNQTYDDFDEPYSYTYRIISDLTRGLYQFILTVLLNLSEKEIRLTKQHFSDLKGYEYYKEKNSK